MPELKSWMVKIQESRKSTDFETFIREICSWIPFAVTKNNGIVSRFPESERVKISSIKDFEA